MVDTKSYSLSTGVWKSVGSLAMTVSAFWLLVCKNCSNTAVTKTDSNSVTALFSVCKNYSNTAVTKTGSNSVTTLFSNSCLILNRATQKFDKLLIKKKLFPTDLTWGKVTKVTKFFEYYWLYSGTDNSLDRPGRKQGNVSVRMACISFGALPCKNKKNLMIARVSMLLKSLASLTCFRACFLPGRAKDLSALWYS